jgi:hypothetical protein
MRKVTPCDKASAEDGRQYYVWLEDYLEQLEGKEAYMEFQDGRCNDSGYYEALVVSLAA